jgi:methyl-accepting chemotaxis protein
MIEMDVTLKFITMLALISFIVFIVFAIISLTKAVKTLQSISDNMDRMSKDLVNSINNITVDIDEIKVELFKSMDNFNDTAQQFKNTARVVENGTANINRTISQYTGLADSLYNRIYMPVSKTGTYISAVTKAVSVFAGFLANKKK